MNTPFYLCIDGGGTKTHGVLLSAGGENLAEGRTGPSNLHTDFSLGITNISSLWEQLAHKAGLEPRQACAETHFALGAAGLDLYDLRLKMARQFMHFAAITQVSDGYAALIGASNGKPAGLIAVGTGVIAYRIDHKGQVITREGWSWIAGDRGSGMWIGRKALYAYLEAHDEEVTFETPLFRRLADHIGRERQSIFAWIQKANPAGLAELAPLVFAAQKEQDPLAGDILDAALQKIVNTIHSLSTPDDDPLYVVGSVGLALRTQIEHKLRRSLSDPLHGQTHGLYLIAQGNVPPDCDLSYPTNAGTQR